MVSMNISRSATHIEGEESFPCRVCAWWACSGFVMPGLGQARLKVEGVCVVSCGRAQARQVFFEKKNVNTNPTATKVKEAHAHFFNTHADLD